MSHFDGIDAIAAVDANWRTIGRSTKPRATVLGNEAAPEKSHFLRDAMIGAALGTAFGVFFFQPLAAHGTRALAERFPRIGRVLRNGE